MGRVPRLHSRPSYLRVDFHHSPLDSLSPYSVHFSLLPLYSTILTVFLGLLVCATTRSCIFPNPPRLFFLNGSRLPRPLPHLLLPSPCCSRFISIPSRLLCLHSYLCPRPNRGFSSFVLTSFLLVSFSPFFYIDRLKPHTHTLVTSYRRLIFLHVALHTVSHLGGELRGSWVGEGQDHIRVASKFLRLLSL